VPAETHVTRGPLGPDDVLALLRDRLAELAGTSDDDVVPSAAFAEDLGIDALALFDLVETLEEDIGERTVGFAFDDEDLVDLRTVGDLVDYVMARLGSGA